MTALVQRMQIVTGFLAVNAEHIRDDDTYSVRVEKVDVRIHLNDRGNAAKALVFALDALDAPVISARRRDAWINTHIDVTGEYAGIPFELTAIANDLDDERMQALDGWANGDLAVTADTLRQLAATDPA